MSEHWDEFSKSVAQPVPRRESLRRLGLVLAGAVLGPLGPQFAWAGHQDPCKAFCQCRNKRQQDQCLKACRACNEDPSRLVGNCGNYFCCGAGQLSCGSYCADLANDPYNCGACGDPCEPPGPYEYGACLDGECRYACVEGAVYCDGACTFLGWDPNNCGGCGQICGGSTPYCNGGACSECGPGSMLCNGICTDVLTDNGNCGACGVVCPSTMYCAAGVCVESEPYDPGQYF
jgi:hypothetical protein